MKLIIAPGTSHATQLLLCAVRLAWAEFMHCPAALSGIPDRWRDPDEFPPGPYLWHCDIWQKIAQLPHVCPVCEHRFFVKEPTHDRISGIQ